MPLSPTEQKVLALYDQGKSYKEISSELGMGTETVKTHCRRICVKSLAVCLRQAAFMRGGQRIKAAA
jgi:DNA-binding NarL/FixJ family response regulator